MTSPLRIVYAGTPEFAVPALLSLLKANYDVCAVYTQPDRPAGRGRKLQPSPVKKIATEWNIPVCQPSSLKEETAQQALQAHQADVMIVAAYGLILPPAVLQAFPFGCINIHASLLPRWRGAAPIHRAILAGDTETGITIMQMDKGLDTGDMLLKVTCPISAGMNADQLHDQLAKLGSDAILETLSLLGKNALQPEPQNDDESCYAAKLEKSEALINWQHTAAELARQVNAFNPWPVAETYLQGKRLRIWEASAIASKAAKNDQKTGDIINTSTSGIDVLTGDGILRLHKIQLPGKKPVEAAAFLNANSVDGEHLDQQ